MNSRFGEISRRKEILIARCALQREQLAQSCRQLQTPVKIAAIIMALGRMLQAHPEIIVGISGLLARRAGGRLSRFAGRVLLLWQALRSLRSWLAGRRFGRSRGHT